MHKGNVAWTKMRVMQSQKGRSLKRKAAAVAASPGIAAPRPGAGSSMMKRARKAVGGGTAKVWCLSIGRLRLQILNCLSAAC